jgi:alpha-L-fucosidase
MTSWFDTARLGMFIHWGHSSQQGIELSWPLTGVIFTDAALPSVSVEQYHSSAITFDPQQYDPVGWARAAKAAGVQYAVLTTKHHDGYVMWDTKTTDFSVMKSPYGRDIVRQYVDAFRAEGIRIGFYFSLADWHHPDYPPFLQEHAPYRFPNARPADPDRWPKFVDVMFQQVKELLTSYGEIAVVWFDGQWERSADQWRAKELREMIKQLQPQILINDRLPGQGDYATPEQFVPPQPLPGPWETCMTMNESWGYNPADKRYKSATQLIHTLCEIAGRGGNLLLNISPRGDGSLPPEQKERLAAISRWMEKHRESILGTQPALEPWQFYGPSTRHGDSVYLHLLMRPYETVTVRGVRTRRVKSVTALGTGGSLKHHSRASIGDVVLNNKDPLGELTIVVPESALEEHATVIRLEFAADPASA